jgi:predicted nuclease with TOPRIM domain
MDTPSSLSREQLESLVGSLKEQLQSVTKQNTELKEQNDALSQEVKTVLKRLIFNIP